MCAQKGAEQFRDSSCILGDAQSGKTHALVKRAQQLVLDNTGSVLVLCASPDGVSNVQRYLSTAGVRVCMARDIALEIMGEPQARERFGRAPRILDAYEERFLFEDLRTSRIKGKRLREVFDFLQCGWTRLADDDPTWLVTLEEEGLSDLVRCNLQFTGGILASELSNFAVKILRTNDQIRARYGVDHVLVDDYPLIDKASQTLARMLARKSFSLSGSQTPTLPVYDAYPYPQGINDFLDQHPNAQVITQKQHVQPQGLIHVLSGLMDAERGGKHVEEMLPPPPVQVKMATDPKEEHNMIARACRQALNAGESVLVVGVNRAWRRGVCETLAGCGITPKTASTPVTVRDFRDEQACDRAYRKTLSRLQVNPHDGVAWRSLIGFGDYVARSAGLREVREAAQQNGMGIEQALCALAKNELEGLDRADSLLAPLARMYEYMAPAIASFDGESPAMQEDFGALSWTDIVSTNVAARAGDEPAVWVGSPQQAATLQASMVIFGGFVNGLIPSRAYLDGTLVGSKRQKEASANVRTLYTVLGRAQQRVLMTGFVRCDLETAEKMELHIARIRLQKGVRVCEIKPSDLLEMLPMETPSVTQC